MRLATCLLFFAALPLSAQPAIPEKDGKVSVPIQLTPNAAPKPLSDFALLVDYGEKQPGEQVGGFLKCFMEQERFFAQDEQEKRLKYLSLPLKDVPVSVGVENGIAYKPKYASMMVMIDQAARFNRTEWNEYFNLRNDGAYMLIPEVQRLRLLALVVHLRLRQELKAEEFDKAVVSVRTLFALAHLLESHPTLIGGFVGLSMASMAVNGLEEMIGQPKCPNLYWNLADLPSPFLSLRSGLGGEKTFFKAQFAKTLPGDNAMSDKELGAAFQIIAELQRMSGPVVLGEKPGVKYPLLAANDKLLDGVRARLKADGVDAATIKDLPKLQLAVLADAHRYFETRDELFKWLNRPHPEALAGLKSADEFVAAERKAGWLIGPMFLPSLQKVKQAQARLDQRLALLMALEAIRLHAFEKKALPGKLADIAVVVPVDPVSGKPFAYEMKDGTATLRPHTPILKSDNRTYEISLRK